MDGISIVVPTVGRDSLRALLDALEPQLPAEGAELIVVQDHHHRGPAAMRNVGWRRARFDWVSFLDDDVVPGETWFEDLKRDLAVPCHVGGVQGRVRVPMPADRPPTDWERCTAGLSVSAWATADMAYRRDVLQAVGGFDERFPRAFREDADLAYRVRRAGFSLLRGNRVVTHPVRPEDRWISLRTQRGNADDAFLRRKYGPGWRRLLRVPKGRRDKHFLVTACGAAALAALAVPAARPASVVLGLSWLAGTADFARRRIAPGPRNAREVTTMLVTSALIPPLAVFHWLRGWRYAGTAIGSRAPITAR